MKILLSFKLRLLEYNLVSFYNLLNVIYLGFFILIKFVYVFVNVLYKEYWLKISFLNVVIIFGLNKIRKCLL